MLPIRYTNGEYPTGTVLSTESLASTTGTPLDPDIEKTGAAILFPVPLIDYANRSTQQSFFPPAPSMTEGPVVILSQMQSAAQNLLIAIEKFKELTSEGDLQDDQHRLLLARLTRSFHSYQLAAIRQIFGRHGFLSKYILGSRMRRSGRATLLPRAGGDPFVVEVPAWMMARMRIREGHYVVVGRDPTIWDGGIEVLRAVPTQEDVIRVHPLIFKQLNADCDGDAVWVLAIPRKHWDEARRKRGGFAKRKATWPTPYSDAGKEVDWDNVEHQMESRSRPDGFSVGPEDIHYDTEFMADAERITGKSLRAECRKMVSGLTSEEWKAAVIKVNASQLRMKVGMGPVGAAAMQIRVLAGEHKVERRSASMISVASEGSGSASTTPLTAL